MLKYCKGDIFLINNNPYLLCVVEARKQMLLANMGTGSRWCETFRVKDSTQVTQEELARNIGEDVEYKLIRKSSWRKHRNG